MGLVELFRAGGIVMWPLLGFSLLTTTLILERGWFWYQLHQRQDRFITQILTLYSTHPQDAITRLKQQTQFPIARIFLAALTLDQGTPDDFRLALESAAQSEMPLLKRFNTVFDTVIGIAPLLGLLGTILGLIQSFAAMDLGNAASTNTTGVTEGLSEALVSTVMGLVVAIFTLLFANTFRGLYRRELAFILQYGSQLELFNRRFHQGVDYATHQ